MQLQTYLKSNGLSEQQFGALVGASEHGVKKWVRGERIPRPDAMRKIFEVTAGAVTAADFFESPPSEDEPEGAAA